MDRADLFTLEDQLASRLTQSLFGDQVAVAGRRYRPVAEAHRLVTLGRYHSNRWIADGQRKAIEYAEQAIAVDPKYADAHALKAEAWLRLDISFRCLRAKPIRRPRIPRKPHSDSTRCRRMHITPWP